MARAARVPRPRYAKPGANPTLETIEYVLAALQKARSPVSRNRLLATLGHWGHSTTRQTLNAAVNFLGDQGMIAEGSKGLIWCQRPPRNSSRQFARGQGCNGPAGQGHRPVVFGREVTRGSPDGFGPELGSHR